MIKYENSGFIWPPRVGEERKKGITRVTEFTLTYTLVTRLQINCGWESFGVRTAMARLTIKINNLNVMLQIRGLDGERTFAPSCAPHFITSQLLSPALCTLGPLLLLFVTTNQRGKYHGWCSSCWKQVFPLLFALTSTVFHLFILKLCDGLFGWRWE